MPEPEAPERRPLRILGKLVLWSLLAIPIYLLASGPVCWALAYRWPAMDRVLVEMWRPVLRIQATTKLYDYLDPYYGWWLGLPGGIDERLRQHPERLQWMDEIEDRDPQRGNSGE